MEYVGGELAANVGEKVPLVFKATNNGNDKEILKFSLTNNWNSTFLPEKLTILPGETKYFTAMVEIPKSASLGNNTVTVRVNYANKFTDANAYINVSEYYSIQMKWVSNRTTSQYMEYGVDVKNDGNVDTEYNLTVMNYNELRDKGWVAEIYYNNTRVNTIGIKSGESQRVYVRLRKITDEPSRSVEILLLAYNSNVSKILRIKAAYGSLTIEKLKIEGEVTIKPPDITAEMMSWIIASVMVIGAGVSYSIIMRRRYPG